MGLTARQRELLGFINAYQQVTGGISLSVADIRDRLGLVSTSVAVRHLNAIEERGHIRRIPNRPRAIEVIDPQPVPAPTLGGVPLQFLPVIHGRP